MSALIVSNDRAAKVNVDAYASGVVLAASSRHGGVVQAPSRRSNDNRYAEERYSVKRRLRGFLLDSSAEECTVVFIVNGKEVQYVLPAKPLREVGIELQFQPFEMTELIPKNLGRSGKIYEFKALVSAKDAVSKALPLDGERLEKRNRILRNFKNAQG